MKNLFRKAVLKLQRLHAAVKEIFSDNSGGFSTHTDNMLYVVIGVVVAGIILAAVVAYLVNTFNPTLFQKITNMFNYN